ncbi:MAG: hypothetical protein Ta2G_03310 [Termitinemataceae bacterium]|nr:MAG: hypothetical protein Ta2G_03310 [Termitinemataceae bacterium]
MKNKAFNFHFFIVLIPSFIICIFVFLFDGTYNFISAGYYFLFSLGGLKTLLFSSLIYYSLPVSIKMFFFNFLIIFSWIISSVIFYNIERKGYKKLSRIISICFVVINNFSGIALFYLSGKN